MKTNYYYITDPENEAFVKAMEELSSVIPCFIELVDIDTLYIEYRDEDICTVEKYLAPFV